MKFTILTHGKMLSVLFYAFLIDKFRIFNKHLCWWTFFAEDKFPFYLGDRRQLLKTFLYSIELDFCIFVQFCLSSVQICTPECVEHVHVEAKDNFQELIFFARSLLSVDRTKDIRLAASSSVCWAILRSMFEEIGYSVSLGEVVSLQASLGSL